MSNLAQGSMAKKRLSQPGLANSSLEFLLTSLLIAMPARGEERMKTTSPLVEQTDLGLSLFRNVQLGRILSETEVIPRDANTHFCFQPGSPLKHEDVIPPELCRTKSSSSPTLDHACPPLSYPETFSIPHTLASGPVQLPFFSPFLRRYKFNSDLETNSGILIRTMESEAKGLCVDNTKSTLEASGAHTKE